jgi:hypothetical protein
MFVPSRLKDFRLYFPSAPSKAALKRTHSKRFASKGEAGDRRPEKAGCQEPDVGMPEQTDDYREPASLKTI